MNAVGAHLLRPPYRPVAQGGNCRSSLHCPCAGSMLRHAARARPIVFLSDFGLGSEWVGMCHSVMGGIAPSARSSTSRTGPPARGRIRGDPPRGRNAVHPGGRRRPRGRRPERRQGSRGRDRDRERPASRRARQRPPVARVGGGGWRERGRADRRAGGRRPIAESFRAPDTLCPRRAARGRERARASSARPSTPARSPS